MNTTLKKLSVASESEPVQVSVTVVKFETDVIGQIPVELLGESAEPAATYRPAIEIDVRISAHQVPRAVSSLEHWPCRRNCSEKSADRVISTRLSSDGPGRSYVASAKEGVVR